MRDYFKRPIGTVELNMIGDERLMWVYNYILFASSDFDNADNQLHFHLDGALQDAEYGILILIIFACCLSLRCFNFNDPKIKELRNRIADFGNFNMITFKDESVFDSLLAILHKFIGDREKGQFLAGKILRSERNENFYYEIVGYLHEFRTIAMISTINSYGTDASNFKCGIYINPKKKFIAFPCSEKGYEYLEKRFD